MSLKSILERLLSFALINNKVILYELDELDGKYAFENTIVDALCEAEVELTALNEHLSETLDTIKTLTLECGKYDYLSFAQLSSMFLHQNDYIIAKAARSHK